jgi:hypothetical protein
LEWHKKSKGNGSLTSATTTLLIHGFSCLPLGLDACIKNQHCIDTWIVELLWQGASHVNLAAKQKMMLDDAGRCWMMLDDAG